LRQHQESRETSTRYLKQIVRYIPEQQLDQLAQFVEEKFANDLDMQMDLFKSLQEGAAQRGVNLTPTIRNWGTQLARRLVSTSSEELSWVNSPLEGSANPANPWVVQARVSSDGTKANFLSSLPNGEQLTGILRSQDFELPSRLTFYLAGHDGFPDKPIHKKNLVRLSLAKDNSVVQQTPPPRNDTAKRITWDLSKVAGNKGYLELIDGDTGNAYAWLAAGRFDPPVVSVPAANPSQISQRQVAGAEIARTLKASDLEPELSNLFTLRNLEAEARAAAARALAAAAPVRALGLLTNCLNDAAEPMQLREKIAQAIGEINSAMSAAALVESLRTAPHRLAVKITQALASTPEGTDRLLTAIERHLASARLLQEKTVQERLSASKARDVESRLSRLTASLPAVDAEREKLIEQRRTSYKAGLANSGAGAKVFEQNCSVCHQIDRKGGLIAPQLDGVASRGVERIIEDILDPNRNVDDAFRYSTITLNDDQVITGLQRREEGEVIVFADGTGKEISVPKKQIKERVQSQSSLMPDNFGEIIAAEDFNNLLAFLMTKGARAVSQK
jgi:putative heme-binding domain-containing protein